MASSVSDVSFESNNPSFGSPRSSRSLGSGNRVNSITPKMLKPKLRKPGDFQSDAGSTSDDDGFGDMFDDSQTTASELFGHATASKNPFRQPAMDPFAPCLEEGEEEEEDDFFENRKRFGSQGEEDLFGQNNPEDNHGDGFGEFSMGQSTETSSELERLKAEKDKAVAAEDYIRAAELKKEIIEEEEKLAQKQKKAAEKAAIRKKLEAEKREAVEAEDYIRAAEIKKQIDELEESDAKRKSNPRRGKDGAPPGPAGKDSIPLDSFLSPKSSRRTASSSRSSSSQNGEKRRGRMPRNLHHQNGKRPDDSVDCGKSQGTLSTAPDNSESEFTDRSPDSPSVTSRESTMTSRSSRSSRRPASTSVGSPRAGARKAVGPPSTPGREGDRPGRRATTRRHGMPTRRRSKSRSRRASAVHKSLCEVLTAGSQSADESLVGENDAEEGGDEVPEDGTVDEGQAVSSSRHRRERRSSISSHTKERPGVRAARRTRSTPSAPKNGGESRKSDEQEDDEAWKNPLTEFMQ